MEKAKDNDVNQLQNKVIDVFFGFGDNIKDFLFWAKEPKDFYDDVKYETITHTKDGSKERSCTLPGGERMKMHVDSRWEFVGQYEGNKYVDFERLERLLSPKNECFSVRLNLNWGRIGKEFWHDRLNIEKCKLCHLFMPGANIDVEAENNISVEHAIIDKIVDNARRGMAVRIWRGANSCDLCGFYYMVNLLDGFPCEIYDMSLPCKYRKPNGRFGKALCWDKLRPEDMLVEVSHCNAMTKKQRQEASDEWLRLVGENSMLRISENGMIKSVSKDYYDGAIMDSLLNGKKFSALRTAWGMMKKFRDVSDLNFWLYRMDELVDSGKITVVKPHVCRYNDFYGIKNEKV